MYHFSVGREMLESISSVVQGCCFLGVFMIN